MIEVIIIEFRINIRLEVLFENSVHVEGYILHPTLMGIDETRTTIGIGVNLRIGTDDMVGMHGEVHIRRTVALYHRCHQECLVGSIDFLMHVLLQYQ